MAYENINLKYSNMCVKDGYFYMFDHDLNVLVQKVDDGSISFTYPLDTTLSSEVIALHYAAGYFWTMQYYDNSSVILSKWKIDNYICKIVSSDVVGNFVVSGVTESVLSDDFDRDEFYPWTTNVGVGGSINIENSNVSVYAGGYSNGLQQAIFINSSPLSDFDVSINCKYKYSSSSQWPFIHLSFFMGSTEILCKS